MTTITRNLPWFVKDLGVSIVGEECYTSLIENLNVTDVKCLKYSLSKGLGIGIVLGGSIMKIPQILLIAKARSARGLSLSSYILETSAYAITLFYSMRNHFPFSTYGENLFLTQQNILITLLIIYYARTHRRKSNLMLLSTTGVLMSLGILYFIPLPLLSFLQLSTLPLSLVSKVPQIRQNHRSKSTGQLSSFAVGSQILGCLARLYTTTTELNDALVSAGYFLALVLNAVLGIQLWIYRHENGIPLMAESELKEIQISGEFWNDITTGRSSKSPSPIQRPLTANVKRPLTMPSPASDPSSAGSLARKAD